MAEPTTARAAGEALGARPAPAPVALTHDPIDPSPLLAAAPGSGDGAVASFVGVVRDNQDGRVVRFLEYEVYEPMAVATLDGLAADAIKRFNVSRVLIRHRLGRLEVGDVSVAIAVAAPHRQEALEACAWLIDTLKAEAPIFKKEHYQDGEAWVE